VKPRPGCGDASACLIERTPVIRRVREPEYQEACRSRPPRRVGDFTPEFAISQGAATVASAPPSLPADAA